MVSLTLSIPQALRQRMAQHSEIKWSEVVRAIISRQLDVLERTDSLMHNSKLTQKDVDELARKTEQGVAKKWRTAVNAARC